MTSFSLMCIVSLPDIVEDKPTNVQYKTAQGGKDKRMLSCQLSWVMHCIRCQGKSSGI